MNSMNRRDVLKALGIGAAAAASAQAGFFPAGARAQTAPLRIVFFYDVSGMCRYRLNRAAGGGTPLGAGADWRFPEAFEPLTPWRARATPIIGVDFQANRTDPTGAGDAHAAGRTCALSGAYRSGPYSASAISINRYLAGRLSESSPRPLSSIELAVVGSPTHRQLSGGTFTGGGGIVPFLGDPVVAYDRMFGSYMAPAMDDSAARRRAAIDALVMEQTDQLVADLDGRAARATITSYRDELRSLHERGRATGTVAATIPERAAVVDAWRSAGSDDGRRWRATSDLMPRMTAAALQANLTRVATIRMLEPPSGLYGFSGDWHEQLVHPASQAFPPGGPLLSSVTAFETLKVQTLVNLLRELEARRDPDGSTVLDNTLVVVCSELGDGWHRHFDAPWMLIGNAQGALRMGRPVTYPRFAMRDGRPDTSRTLPRSATLGSGSGNEYNSIARSNNDLFVTIANAMGVSISSFGAMAANNGPMTELRA